MSTMTTSASRAQVVQGMPLINLRHIPLDDAIRMVSETPAKIMGVYDRKGSLQRGKDADIIVMDDNLNIRAVWAMGKLVPDTYTI